MLIVACQSCSETNILAGSPDSDGVARATWSCPYCGTGQVIQLAVSNDAAGGDLRNMLAGFALASSEPVKLDEEVQGLAAPALFPMHEQDLS